VTKRFAGINAYGWNKRLSAVLNACGWNKRYAGLNAGAGRKPQFD